MSRFRALQLSAVAGFLLLGAWMGGWYAGSSKDGVHPAGALVAAIVLLSLAWIAARQRPPRAG